MSRLFCTSTPTTHTYTRDKHAKRDTDGIAWILAIRYLFAFAFAFFAFHASFLYERNTFSREKQPGLWVEPAARAPDAPCQTSIPIHAKAAEKGGKRKTPPPLGHFNPADELYAAVPHIPIYTNRPLFIHSVQSDGVTLPSVWSIALQRPFPPLPYTKACRK